ncbi:hypothetical protein P700755_000283 [Psychroflexus torquis ATCC 700755]|uniref:Uncharacterized protein n=1 Tax=Psychroflexus torquis (strain ATCC 700755 / CIP 106069 / ACAM 623) TaxID=313595 RepID=K4IA67_PSYTT|nr:DUF1343 domain-containing protein [Psychroflexus torquis]AFU67324.1 hypothetical protein P700755_000283 [Psychroflexus torquis ATCC 700755]
MKEVETRLDVVLSSPDIDTRSKKNVALFCQKALMVSDYSSAAENFRKLVGFRFINFFGFQRGFATDVHDNMIVFNYIENSHFNIPVYFLYSETPIPADDILEGIDHLFIDLQDMGCRMDTYNYTLSLLLYKCIDKNTEIIALDRPKLLNGIDIEGHILNLEFEFQIGRHALPARHALTIGEIALLHQKKRVQGKANLTVIKMQNWERNLFFEDTGLPWILPLSNLARAESTCTFPSTVFFEGTKLSESRGTKKALEIIEHPKNEPYSSYKNHLKSVFKNEKLRVFTWRPIIFLLTFQKYFGKVCGGFEIFVTDKTNFRPWRVAQLLIGELYPYLVNNFIEKHPPYKYNYAQN